MISVDMYGSFTQALTFNLIYWTSMSSQYFLVCSLVGKNVERYEIGTSPGILSYPNINIIDNL